MLSHTLRVARIGTTRAARQVPAVTQRAITTSSYRRADMVQDAYLKQIKEYKMPQPKPSDAEGHVQKFKAPAAPASPEETNLAEDLKAWQQQKVEVEGQAEDSGEQAQEPDWFEREDNFEAELKDEEHH